MSKTHPFKDVADHLASKGRYGDQYLVHMNKYELQGLASMVPGGKLTINPDTGQPEAFLPFLLPLLGGLAGSAFLPGAIAGLGLGTISATLGGALGAGAASTAGGLIEGKDIGSALGKGVASGLLSYGLGSAVDGLAGAGEAAAGAGTGAAEAAASSAPDLTASAGGVQDWAPAGADAATATASQGFKYPDIEAAIQANQTPQGIGGMMSQYGSAAKNLMNPDALKHTFIDNASSTLMPIGLGIAGGALGDGPTQSQSQMPMEPTYGPASTQGTGRRYTPKPYSPLGYEQSYFQYADGGLVNDDKEEYADHKKWIPIDQMPHAKKQSIYGAMRDKQRLDREDELYGRMGPVASDNPLMRRSTPVGRYAQGGAISGPGGGLDDAIPAVIDGRQPALLSSGEWVAPAHFVSALGNGSTEEGIRQLEGMTDRVMSRKYGAPDRKPKPVNPKKFLPA